jgi:hypothetical protein
MYRYLCRSLACSSCLFLATIMVSVTSSCLRSARNESKAAESETKKDAEIQEKIESLEAKIDELQQELETVSLPAGSETPSATGPTLVKLRLAGLDMEPCVTIPNRSMQYRIIVSESGIALRVDVLSSTGDSSCDDQLVQGLMQSEWRACPSPGSCEGIRTLELKKH